MATTTQTSFRELTDADLDQVSGGARLPKGSDWACPGCGVSPINFCSKVERGYLIYYCGDCNEPLLGIAQ